MHLHVGQLLVHVAEAINSMPRRTSSLAAHTKPPHIRMP